MRSKRGETDRSKMWTDMDFPSGMKEDITKGWVQPVHGETPRFTESGWVEYDRLYADASDFFKKD